MIPFHFSSNQEAQPLGWLADTCSNCEEVRAFFGYRLMNTWKWLGATVDERAVTEAVICSFCRMAFAFPAGIPLQVDTAWQEEDGLQDLVDRTNPALGIVQQRSEPSAQAVLGLLRSLESQRPNFMELLEETSARTVGIGALLSGFAFVIIGNLLVYLGPHKEEVWSAIVFFQTALPGIAIGAIIGGIIGGMDIARNQIALAIKSTMSHYNLKCSQLKEALAREPGRLRKVASIIQEVCQSDGDAK